jgi:hypothetical protein
VSKFRFRISISLDGYVAGPRQSVENPLGVGGMRLHEWVFPLTVWREMHGMPGGEVNASSKVVEASMANIGATIMGRNMFGGHPGRWDRAKPWNGWRARTRFVTPFVPTHHARAARARGLHHVHVHHTASSRRSRRRGGPPARTSHSPAQAAREYRSRAIDEIAQFV